MFLLCFCFDLWINKDTRESKQLFFVILAFFSWELSKKMEPILCHLPAQKIDIRCHAPIFLRFFLTASRGFCGPRNFFHLFLMAWLSLAQLRQWISACCFCFWKYLGKLYVFKFGSNNANFLNWRDQNYFQNFFLETYQCSTLLLGTRANGTYGQVGQLPTALMDTVNKPLITGAMNQDCFGV